MVFTYVTLLFFFFGLYDDWCLKVCKPMLWGVALSFSAAPLFDPSVYSRMRAKHRWSRTTFWAGNILLHFVPLFRVESVRPDQDHTQMAAALHIFWYLLVTHGSLDLSTQYVPLPRWVWMVLMTLAVGTELNTYSEAWDPLDEPIAAMPRPLDAPSE